MKTRLPAAMAVVLLQACSCTSRTPEQGQALPKDFTNVSPGELGIKPVSLHKDPNTGFLVGGKNSTARIKSLSEVNGRTIAELEKDMRPGAASEVGSRKGFLGPDERLLDVLAEDNRYVVDQLGLAHQELARHLHALGEIGSKFNDQEFLYHGRRFKVKVTFWKGDQLSPFYDGTLTSRDAMVQNFDNGKQIEFSLLVPHMIERYGFYEGKGTPYRVEPRNVLEVLDFLGKP